jgi:hypothetical protein
MLIILLSGCGNQIDLVKDGTLNYDKSLTVGEALEDYSYFKDTSWNLIEADQGRKVVEFSGTLNCKRMLEDLFLDLETIERGKTSLASGSHVEEVTAAKIIMDQVNKKWFRDYPELIEEHNFTLNYDIQFLLSKSDDSFELAYTGLSLEGDNMKGSSHYKEDFPEHKLNPNGHAYLKYIYVNRPLYLTLPVLTSLDH